MRLFYSMLIALSLMSFSATPSAQATSSGYVDAEAHKFIIRTKLFFYGEAVDAAVARHAVEEISRLWNQPKIKYYRGGEAYPIEFRFDYAVNSSGAYTLQLLGPPSILTSPLPVYKNPSADTRIQQYEPLFFSKVFPLQMDGYIRMKALVKDPELNVIKMTHASKENNEISSMACGDQMGEFVVENDIDGGTTFAHEFGHSLGLPHAFNENCVTEQPSVMCARGSATLPKYQYQPNKKPWQLGGTINPIYRSVRVKDILNLHLTSIPENSNGKKIIGPHMRDVCLADHSSI